MSKYLKRSTSSLPYLEMYKNVEKAFSFLCIQYLKTNKNLPFTQNVTWVSTGAGARIVVLATVRANVPRIPSPVTRRAFRSVTTWTGNAHCARTAGGVRIAPRVIVLYFCFKTWFEYHYMCLCLLSTLYILLKINQPQLVCTVSCI